MYGFLAVVLTTSALGVEQWPLTGWRLFSNVRSGVTTGWHVVTVDDAHHETPVDFAALGRGFRGAAWRLADFPTMSGPQREAVCRAWADAVGTTTRASVRGVVVYRTRRAVTTDPGGPPPPVTRVRRYRCADR